MGDIIARTGAAVTIGGRVTVVLGCPVEERHVQRLRGVSPRVQIVEAGALFQREEQLAAVGDQRGLARVRGELDRVLESADVLGASFAPNLPGDLPRRAPRLRWVQLTFAGADQAMTPEILASPIAVTVARGVLGRTIAEHVLGFMLFFSRRFHRAAALQREGRWDPEETGPWGLRGRTVGLVGFGDIAQEVARLARTLDMRIVAVRRSARQPVSNTEGVDLLLPPSHLTTLLEASDFVVLALPLTPQTRGLLGEAELRRMQPTAYLINVARGAIVEEAALVRALQEGWMAGAGLDVFQREPLPPESPLWALPNVLITPHVAGPSEPYLDRYVELLCYNLGRLLRGEPLLHLVDKERWY